MMKLIPAIGMAMIKEDKIDFSKSAIDIPDMAKKGVGTTGVIVAVTNLFEDEPSLYWESLLRRCPWIPTVLSDIEQGQLSQFCSAMERGHEKVNQYKEGDHVVFSKFNEQICIYEDGKEYIYYSVPVQSILGFLHD